LGYNTVYSGAQSAKSVLTVGAIHANGDLAGFSSKGPGRGRRLKPEIVAPGAEIISTVPDNGYGSNNGTSMSSPAVVGGLALLYQRYQQLHGSKPENALMKPLVCNTATDQGNPGPDYAYGFGMMNLNRALQVLQGGRFYKDSVSHQQTKSKTISVPQGMAQIKLMLYWTDPAASPLSNKHLINDLDLKVTAPDGSVIRPLVLDTLPSLVMNAAARGEDHINNIEQVVINTPVAGNYIITVDGYEISIGTDQAFYIVYDLVADGIELTFPAPGEKLAPGDVVNVQWDNWGNKTSTFSLNFSGDNGQSWQLLSANIPAGTTSFNWTVPDAITNQARLQLIRNSDGKTSAPNPFRILGVPQMQLSAAQCPGSVAFEWSAIPGATNYEVMRYRNSEMVHAAFTTGTNYVFRNLSTDSTYWVTVRALYNGQAGRRAIALSRKPDNGSCAGAVYNNDLKVDTLVYPLVGRQFTASQLGAEAIQMRIRNLDDDPSAAFTVSYSVNGSTWVSEAVQNNIAANSLLGYRFQTPINFSAAGEYVVRLAVSSPLDQNKGNDTATYTVRSLANHPVSIQAGIAEDLEGVAATTYFTSYTGLQGLERFDYDKYFSSQYLRITNQNAQNPTNSFTLFYDQNGGTAPNEQGLTATYNLSLFDTATHAVGLEFTYVHRATGPRSVDSLLIRGSDRDPWILVEDLFANATQTVTRSVYVPVGDHLKANRQNYSSSFQVRWSVDKSNNVILLDNIKLYNAASDVSVVSIDSMLPYNCGLTATPVQVTINNRTKTSVSNLVVKYRVNNGPVVSETIPAMPATSSIAYTFTTKADLSAADHYTILAWTDYLQDSYRKNDTAKITIRNQPFIASFPHIEDFEKNNGGWYTNGTNSSWEWGTPSSPRINGAASGSNAWKTNLDGNHNALESSWLYTGCYDFTRLTKPMISMSLALNTDSCSVSALCELMILQYSVDGRNWATMPPRSVYNWPAFIAAKEYNRWHVVTQRPRDTARTIQFRFQFRSDAYNNYEGIGIDDFHVYDSTTLIYDAPVSASAQQKITGQQQWMAFQKDGKLLAAMQSPGQNLGDVQLKTYMHQGSVRNFHGQYYVNRNFVFQSTHAPTDSVLVRLYFTDKEGDSLLFARQCPGCTKPVNAYRFGISTYASIQAAELDSSILNNRIGNWNFIPVSKVRIVPFANGYYAEFKTKDLGEFRLSNGGLDGSSDLPLQFEMFTAQRSSANAELQWRTKSEINIQRFDIEVATSNEAYAFDQFQKVGEVSSKGRSAIPQAYNFTDATPGKKGIRYYRLKNIDAYGNYTYTQPVPVIFNEELTWQVYPNPSGGKFTLLYQARSGEVLKAVLYNAIGKRIKELQLPANGFVQRTEINLSANAFASGVYFLQIQTSEKNHLLRVVKQ
ncbi:MAG TPA: S8 family serine peptidase, partial [Flavisolibacter sp.]